MKKIVMILFLMCLSCLLFSCNKNIMVEDIDVYSEIIQYDNIYKAKLVYYVFPSNANKVDISWKVNRNDASIDEDGVFYTDVKNGEFVVTCLEKNSNVSKDYIINLDRSYNYDAIWIDGRSYNYINNLDNDLLKDFVNRYNNCLIYSFDMVRKIKEDVKIDSDIYNTISELEKSYFSEENLKNKMYVMCKLSMDDLDLLPTLDVRSIELNEKGLTLFLNQSIKSNNENEELYFLLEVDKTLFNEFYNLNIENDKVFNIKINIKFLPSVE